MRSWILSRISSRVNNHREADGAVCKGEVITVAEVTEVEEEGAGVVVEGAEEEEAECGRHD